MPGEENKVEETKTDDVEVKDNVETKDKADTEVDATDTEKPAADPILESLGDDTQAEKTDEKPVDNEGTEDKEEKTKGEGEEDTDAEAKPDAEQEETKSEEKIEESTQKQKNIKNTCLNIKKYVINKGVL